MGGAWDTPAYLFFTPDAADPLDRSSHNGFRCAMTGLPPDHVARLPASGRPDPEPLIPTEVGLGERAAHFEYDRLPLAATVDSVSEALPTWRREFVSFASAYDDQPLRATPADQRLVLLGSGVGLLGDEPADAL